MKKIVILSMLLPGTVYSAESWLSSIANTAGRMAVYPVKVIINKGPRFLEEESPELYNFATESTTNQTVATVVSTAAFTVGGLVIGAAALPFAALGIVALDYSYPDEE